MEWLIGEWFVDGWDTLLLLPPHPLVAFYCVIYRLDFGLEGVNLLPGSGDGVLQGPQPL